MCRSRRFGFFATRASSSPTIWRSSAATSGSPTPSSPIAQPAWPAHSVREGARSGDRVAFLSTNCHRLLEAYYGVLEADCVLLPLNVRLAPAELSYVLNDAGARFLFVEQALLPLAEAFRRDVPGIERIYLLDGAPQADWLSPHSYEELIATAAPFHRDLMEVDENALAELFYTSGTSDAPRGVMLTHRNIYLHALLVIASGRTSRDVAGEHLLRFGRPAHHSAVSRQRLGIGAYRDARRRDARHGPSVRPRPRSFASSSRRRSRPVRWCRRWPLRW